LVQRWIDQPSILGYRREMTMPTTRFCGWSTGAVTVTTNDFGMAASVIGKHDSLNYHDIGLPTFSFENIPSGGAGEDAIAPFASLCLNLAIDGHTDFEQ
jgi:hypothetical protein